MEGPVCLSLSPLHTHSPRTARESVSLSPPSLIAQQPGAVTLRAAGKMSLPRPGFFPLHHPEHPLPAPSFALRTTWRAASEVPSVPGGSGSPGVPRRVRGVVISNLTRSPAASRGKHGAVVLLYFSPWQQTSGPQPPPLTPTPSHPTPTPQHSRLHTPPTRPPPDAFASKPRGERAGKPWACRHNPRPEGRAFVNLNESYLGFSTYLLYLFTAWNELHHYKVKQGDGEDA